jgi:hypothetical protein
MAKQVTAYKIHNMSRSIETRHLRAASTAQRAPKKLLLGGGIVRVVRGRPATVTEVALKRMLKELQDKEKLGWLMVTTPTGLRVDLDTLKPLEGPPVTAPKPHPPQDTAATDNKYPVGQDMPQHPGGAARSEDLELPAVVNPDIPEGKEDLTVVAQAIYDGGWSHKELKEDVAPEYGVEDLSGYENGD